MEISVGIPTLGNPILEKKGDYTLLKNMLIGKNFHWQQAIEALLPGVVEETDSKDFRIINRLPLEKYLECVVGSEMNPEAPFEFLKAHAVISRSWALGKILNIHNHSEKGKENLPDMIVNWEDTCDHEGFDVCSDDHCQRYQGIQPIPSLALSALKSTEGEILISPSGKLVDARFSKCCGGRTEVFSTCWQPREEECLKSFEDPWCNLDSLTEDEKNKILKSILKDYDLANSGGFLWETVITAEQIKRNLVQKFSRDIGDITDLNIISRGASGRIDKLQIKATKGNLIIGKELMIRRLLADSHLYSSWFDIEALSESLWHLKGHGWGHGVGLCQIGAARMALEGYNYKDILTFYYPGASIKKTFNP
ncbi:MAG: SpoIID/LytB domain-containing protein [Muribaculaceae bacterium]|nr:SpoIID/LytB domain-containing protein [Muribaculaceae bacterium]